MVVGVIQLKERDGYFYLSRHKCFCSSQECARQGRCSKWRGHTLLSSSEKKRVLVWIYQQNSSSLDFKEVLLLLLLHRQLLYLQGFSIFLWILSCIFLFRVLVWTSCLPTTTGAGAPLTSCQHVLGKTWWCCISQCRFGWELAECCSIFSLTAIPRCSLFSPSSTSCRTGTRSVWGCCMNLKKKWSCCAAEPALSLVSATARRTEPFPW